MMLSVILLSMLMIGDTTPYSQCDQSSDLWQKLKSDLRDTLCGQGHWGDRLVDFNAGKT